MKQALSDPPALLVLLPRFASMLFWICSFSLPFWGQVNAVFADISESFSFSPFRDYAIVLMISCLVEFGVGGGLRIFHKQVL